MSPPSCSQPAARRSGISAAASRSRSSPHCSPPSRARPARAVGAASSSCSTTRAGMAPKTWPSLTGSASSSCRPTVRNSSPPNVSGRWWTSRSSIGMSPRWTSSPPSSPSAAAGSTPPLSSRTPTSIGGPSPPRRTDHPELVSHGLGGQRTLRTACGSDDFAPAGLGCASAPREGAMPRTPLPWAALGLDLVTLRVFKAAVEERSLARAAERERLALSALSRRIADIEARLGTALLRRHDRGVEATAAGEALLRHLGPLFDLLDRAFADVEAFAAGARGHIRLHANISAVAGFLPEALAGFLAANPCVEVSFEERFSADILHAVRIGAADLGLVSGTVRAPELRLLPWCEDRLVAVLPADHPLAA